MINKVILVGRLTRAPELRSTPNGVSVCSFSLAFDNKNKAADGSRTSSFINCTAWRQNAEFICNYCPKGTQVGIEGNLQERKYTRKDNTQASVIEIIVEGVTLFGSRNNNANNNISSNSVESNSGYERDNDIDATFGDEFDDIADDDAPFH